MRVAVKGYLGAIYPTWGVLELVDAPVGRLEEGQHKYVHEEHEELDLGEVLLVQFVPSLRLLVLPNTHPVLQELVEVKRRLEATHVLIFVGVSLVASRSRERWFRGVQSVLETERLA